MPVLPDITFARMIELLPSAIVIAFLASIESLLSAMVTDKMIGGYHRPNAEVLAQGFANIGSALFGVCLRPAPLRGPRQMCALAAERSLRGLFTP